MHVKSVHLAGFRRFTDLKISGISANSKLVMLAGPNGNGKSSLFDAFVTWGRRMAGFGLAWDPEYYSKKSREIPLKSNEGVSIEFHEPTPADITSKKKIFYVRSAYRNDPAFQLSSLMRTGSALDDQDRLEQLIKNNATVSQNYQRLVAQSLEDAFERDSPSMTIKEFRDKTLGEISRALSHILPEITLDSLGNPLAVGTFKFTKGISKGYDYRNLSGGEKATFDLILDFVIKRREFDNTIFCIDEPETHLNPKLHGMLLREFYDLTSNQCQLWIATHSIGMLRAARDLSIKFPGTVSFLDFNRNFDQSVELRPIHPNRSFWENSLEIALDDLASLVAPSQIVLCEGADRHGFPGEASDSKIYDQIFSFEFPETRFISLGSTADLEGDRVLVVQALAGLIPGLKVIKLIDRDDKSDQEASEYIARGFRVLSERHIESYLYSDEILMKLCAREEKVGLYGAVAQAKQDAIKASIAARNNPPNDIKSASGEIYNDCKSILGLTSAGSNRKAFMRDTLAPLVTPQTQTYANLRKDIFGI
jgi:predicted ATPase